VDTDNHGHVCRCTEGALSKPAQNCCLGQSALEVPDRQFQQSSTDCIGKFTLTKAADALVLVCLDSFSKYVWLIPLRETTSPGRVFGLRPHFVRQLQVFCFSRFKQLFCDSGMHCVMATRHYPSPSHAG
jgi:hypothetical protein